MAENTSTIIVGKAPLTTVRLTNGSLFNVPRDVPVPEGIDKDDQKRLLKEGYLTELEIVDDVVQEDDADEGPTGVKEILAEVGDDAEAAQRYLDAENAAKKPRKTLVEALQKVIDAAKGDGS